jgi:1-acyl-sn-glycerol-3-phosphate acyltransferase
LCFIIAYIIFYPFVYFNLRKAELHPKAFRIRVIWVGLLNALGLILFDVEGKEKIKDEPYIICMNHQSYLDILFAYKVVGKYFFKFIGKKELLKWPMIGVFFRKGMDIPIDRVNAKSARESLELSKEALRNGISIAIFPEGVIPDNTPQLLPFKNGAFKIALELNIPILPITFLDNWKRMYGDPVRFFSSASPGRCRAIVHDPIITQGMDLMDIGPLRDKVYEVINAPLVEVGYSKKME